MSLQEENAQAANGQQPATNEVDEASLLRDAVGYLQRAEQAASAGDLSGAKEAVNAAKGLINSASPAMASRILELIQSVRVDNNAIVSAELSELELNNEGSSMSARYAPLRCCSQKIRNYFDRELSGQSYQTMQGVYDDKGRLVGTRQGETVSGETARQDFVRLVEVSAPPEERQATGEQKPATTLNTPEGTNNVMESLQRMEGVRVAKIMQGPGSEEEKKAKAEEVHKKFEEARKRVEELKEAQRRERSAPPGFGKAMHENTEHARQRAERIIRRDVVEGALADGDAPQREQATERTASRMPPPPPQRPSAQIGR